LINLIQTTSKGGIISIKKEIKVDENAMQGKLKLAIYRIVQEQFNNILKHANAKTLI